jgi:hypothetical protein
LGGVSANRGCDGGAGYGAFAEAAGAADTKVFVKLAGGEHEQKALAHGLGRTTFGAVKFAGRKSPKLLRHEAGKVLERQ